ncbi:Sn1-specific diacylglycerol lipase beta [Zootermopsis nevadensis]|uniref:sn-1-specific diacylglycerol lipase n=2 Tax=Zootermopsis nevadensis TaxID=136037 RepID=A0A067RUY4_ZOONE|nr:Sn1-specific diacylglycerol lipase beta [Zootermopsis nevadensis]
MIGVLTILACNIVLLVPLVNRSAQGAILDTAARRVVAPILTVKILLLLPEVGWNIMGTIWMFGHSVQCSSEHFTRTVTEGLVLFNWVLLALTLFGLAVVFDPLGSAHFNEQELTLETLRHRRLTRLWMRRLKWTFCWMRRDEHGKDAFLHMANFFSSLFRGTDMVPSDYVAGFILMRVLQKRKTREMRRLELLDQQPQYIQDVRTVMADAPDWMSLELAHHFLKLAIAAYTWPFVMYRYPFSGLVKLTGNMTCCSCLRSKSMLVQEDNCCFCNLAGIRYLSMVADDDILFASFRNRIFEMPYYLVADHKTGSIVLVIRGSISMRDIFTDLNAGAEKFEAEGLPPNSMAHRGMVIGAHYIKRDLEDLDILNKAFGLYPHYKLAITGHSLGAAVGVLVGCLLRSKYPNLRVYALCPPAAVLSREAARYTEDFTFSVGVGDDFVMRLSIDSSEDLRTTLLHVLEASHLPKYRIMLNGFGYAIFGVPTRDLETTWKSECTTPPAPGHLPLLFRSPEPTTWSEVSVLEKDVPARRFSRTRLFSPGRILHITYRKKSGTDKKSGARRSQFVMRWAAAEEFMQLAVMPRMVLDHLPENVEKVLETILQDQHEREHRLHHNLP